MVHGYWNPHWNLLQLCTSRYGETRNLPVPPSSLSRKSLDLLFLAERTASAAYFRLSSDPLPLPTPPPPVSAIDTAALLYRALFSVPNRALQSRVVAVR